MGGARQQGANSLIVEDLRIGGQILQRKIMARQILMSHKDTLHVVKGKGVQQLAHRGSPGGGMLVRRKKAQNAIARQENLRLQAKDRKAEDHVQPRPGAGACVRCA